jgi:hypothetical protein
VDSLVIPIRISEAFGTLVGVASATGEPADPAVERAGHLDGVPTQTERSGPAMSNPNPVSSLFTQVDITPAASTKSQQVHGYGDEHAILLRQILTAQDRQNELMEELVNLLGSHHKQRQQELAQWKQANPQLSKSCRKAAETLSKVQVEFLDKMTEEVHDNADVFLDGEFMLNEFVDRFGPRMAHLNGVLQVLSQLGANNAAPEAPAT